MRFFLTILGSSSALPANNRFPSAHLLNVNERFYLIDCGEGTQIQLRKFGVSLLKINHLFLSHLHGDHVFGIFGLLSTLELMGRKGAFTIYAPKDFDKILQFYLSSFSHSNSFPINHIQIPSETSIIHEDKQCSVTSFPLTHKVETYGFLFKEQKRMLNLKNDVVKHYNIPIRDIPKIKLGEDYFDKKKQVIIKNNELTQPPYKQRSYAYCTDTIYKESLKKLLSGVDLLYHEATFLHKEIKRARETCHSTSLQAAELASKANVKKLLIGHFSARYKDVSVLLNEARVIFKDTTAVKDGDVFEVKLTRP